MTNHINYKPFDIWEQRRQTEGWYFARAMNTHFSAFALSKISKEQLEEFANEAPYSGDWEYPKLCV